MQRRVAHAERVAGGGQGPGPLLATAAAPADTATSAERIVWTGVRGTGLLRVQLVGVVGHSHAGGRCGGRCMVLNLHEGGLLRVLVAATLATTNTTTVCTEQLHRPRHARVRGEVVR